MRSRSAGVRAPGGISGDSGSSFRGGEGSREGFLEVVAGFHLIVDAVGKNFRGWDWFGNGGGSCCCLDLGLGWGWGEEAEREDLERVLLSLKNMVQRASERFESENTVEKWEEWDGRTRKSQAWNLISRAGARIGGAFAAVELGPRLCRD